MNRILSSQRNILSVTRFAQTVKRWQTGVARDAVRCLKPGQQLHGYTVNKVVEIPELFTTTVLLKHDGTGAEHMHMARDDDNNAFSVSFRTTPMDSTGIPHILEHTVLCGSQKYPVRDPFMKMLSRSLATFMNAFTASDWTMYPFCSQNKQDFQNLLSVYLDAAFYPQLRDMDFKQEGWRLEHEDPNDVNTPLVFKGVVYNEMKGVFSNSQHVYSEAVQNKLMPGHTYGVISGGDPAFIPNLTWAELKNFHAVHYHPSNARFYTYGNFPLEQHLQFIGENYLQNFQKIQVNTKVPKEERWTEPRTEHITCQPDPMAADPKKQTTVAVNFLLSEITDPFESAVLGIIGSLLVDGETSPFYQALLSPQIGSSYSPVIGHQGYTYESSFHVGLQGVHPDDVGKVKAIIDSTIDKVIEEGFEQKRIDALLHKIELSLKHQTSNFGLHLIISVASPWNHDGDPTESLQVNKVVERFKQELNNNPRFLQEKVKHYFKDNPHRLCLTMGPDDNYEANRIKAEKKKLETFTSRLSEDDKKIIYNQGLELLELQMAKEDVSCLPTLKVVDMEPNIKSETFHSLHAEEIPLQVCTQPTNEVVYLRMISNMADVPIELKPYVPLFCDVITKVGAGPYDYKQLSQQMELCTGGMDVNTHIVQHHTETNTFEQGILFSSYCLEQNLERMLNLWTEIFNRPDFMDKDRLTMLIRMSAAELASSIADSGHSYAITSSAANVSAAAKLHEQFDGMTQVRLMKNIAEGEDQTHLIHHLDEIHRYLLNKKSLRLALNASPDFTPEAVKMMEKFVPSIPGKFRSEDHFSRDPTFTPVPTCTHFELPFPVNFMGKSLQTVPYSHPEFASLKVLSKILSRKFLHREIREKGGAYGSGALCKNGVFSFFSYRDPNSLQTLEVFDRAAEWSANSGFTDEDIDEAKLSVFQETDKPVPPGDMGMTHFISGVNDSMRQEMRERLFTVNRENIVDVASKYLVPGKSVDSSSCIGPSNDSISQDSRWHVIRD